MTEAIMSSTHSNKTQYFLDKLQEESAEIIQAVSKIRRFGPDNHHPERQDSNKTEFIGEVEDFLALIAALESTGFMDLRNNHQNITRKFNDLTRP